MPLALYAGIAVSNFATARDWYSRLFGGPPMFVATPTKAVWDLAEHRSVFIDERPEHAGHANHSIFVDDLDGLVAAIAERGINAEKQETYGNGVRRAAYRDPDGNEIGFGSIPL
ncbi:VOC family protein [Corallococcus exercitus]|uniref:VOC family protein n=1 Tax=Corallococcus exercitus TaxID=2316736 RepID=UPI0035D4AEA8